MLITLVLQFRQVEASQARRMCGAHCNLRGRTRVARLSHINVSRQRPDLGGGGSSRVLMSGPDPEIAHLLLSMHQLIDALMRNYLK
jgi:hypothetical protein